MPQNQYIQTDSLEPVHAAVDSPITSSLVKKQRSIKEILNGVGDDPNDKSFDVGYVYVQGGLDKHTKGIDSGSVEYVEEQRRESKKQDIIQNLKDFSPLLLLAIFLIILWKIGKNGSYKQKKIPIINLSDKYRTIIDGIIHWSNGKAKVLNQSPEIIAIGYTYEGSKVTFTLTPFEESQEIEIHWRLRSQQFGNHSYDWQFPEDDNQFEIMEIVKTDLNNYINQFTP